MIQKSSKNTFFYDFERWRVFIEDKKCFPFTKLAMIIQATYFQRDLVLFWDWEIMFETSEITFAFKWHPSSRSMIRSVLT